jgi:hypothetical protein
MDDFEEQTFVSAQPLVKNPSLFAFFHQTTSICPISCRSTRISYKRPKKVRTESQLRSRLQEIALPLRLGRSAFRSKKLNDSVGCFLGPLLKNPMTGVFQHDNGDIIGDQLHLRRQLIA